MFALTTGITPTTGGTHNVMTKRDVKCYNFDGVNEYVNTTMTGNELLATDALTIAAWVRFDDGQTDANERICGVEEGGDQLKLFKYTTGHIGFMLLRGGSYQIGKTSAQLSNGQSDWVFVAGKYDAAAAGNDYAWASLNVSDWEHTTEGAGFSKPVIPNQNMWLGATNDDGAFEEGMAGSISNIVFFNKALSQAELSELYDGGMAFKNVSPNQIGGVIAWYRMGDESSDSNTVLVDASGNGNTGTVVNMEGGDLDTDSPGNPFGL